MSYTERPDYQTTTTTRPDLQPAAASPAARYDTNARYDTVRTLPLTRSGPLFAREDMYAFIGAAVMILGPLLMAATRH